FESSQDILPSTMAIILHHKEMSNISFVAFPVSSTNSPTKILPKTLGPINVNVGPQMVRKPSNLRI
uniref:Uncharacterized protein n=1 Tax=Ursus maritimus TaxID=29073 RepID=A0A452VFF8_URSMA